jgi:hypothetical protein
MGQNVDVITVTLMSTSGAYIFDLSARIGTRGKETDSSFAEVIAVCLHGVCRQFHVMEHAFKFDRKLEAAFDFELGEHASFCIIGYRSVVKEALCKMSLIISLEDILFCDKPK